ncbi:fructose-bisphosphatase class II [Shigella flexneri]
MPLSQKCGNLACAYFAIPDGDVAASILTCMPDSEVDVLYGIGGQPEGIGPCSGDPRIRWYMNGRLLARHDVKGDNEENRRIGERSWHAAKRWASKPVKYCVWAIARSDNVLIFFCHRHHQR